MKLGSFGVFNIFFGRFGQLLAVRMSHSLLESHNLSEDNPAHRRCRPWQIAVPVVVTVIIVAICIPSIFVALKGSNKDSTPVYVDIHIPLSDTSAYSFASSANSFLRQQFASSTPKGSDTNPGINFATIDTPHITLYLTAFQCPGITTDECLKRVSEHLQTVVDALRNRPPCTITVTDAYPAGTYAMLNVSLTPCLQSYSDAVVDAIHSFSQPNQTVPGWVLSMPEPARSEKIRLVQQFGSPNVYQGFAPHVSVGWAENASMVTSAVDKLRMDRNKQTSSFLPGMVAMGSVGAHGTVLTGKDLGKFPFKP